MVREGQMSWRGRGVTLAEAAKEASASALSCSSRSRTCETHRHMVRLPSSVRPVSSSHSRESNLADTGKVAAVVEKAVRLCKGSQVGNVGIGRDLQTHEDTVR